MMRSISCNSEADNGYSTLLEDGSNIPLPDSLSLLSQSESAIEDAIDSNWSASLSSCLYKVDAWGAPYFSVNTSGNVTVRPYGAETLPHQEIDIFKVVKKVTNPKSLGGLGLQPPLIVRFPDVLHNRLESLQSAFDCAIVSQGYGSHYQGVYPVKCNQDRFVVEDVVRFGSPFRFGLEAGSKPELLLAMNCLCKGNPDAFLICNGYKDEEYISLALFARKMAFNTVIVLEQEGEIDRVIRLSEKLGIHPVIGLRAKLRTKHSGHFGSTSGEKGKFGLTSSQILRVVKQLRERKMLDCLKLLHFHMGSQIPSTALLAVGVREAAQILCELVRHGADMEVLDIGGGLGIDYDGSKSGKSDQSVSYDLEDYAGAVVQTLKSVCDANKVSHPVICSESGRALVSHHSVLIFEAVSSSSSAPSPSSLQCFLEELTEEACNIVINLIKVAGLGEEETTYIYADQLKQKCSDLFREGVIGMEQLAAADSFCEMALKAMKMAEPILTYQVNLSVFTSIPDFWGVGQLFPIIPIHRMNERPAVRGVLSDLTCDSDGKVDKFIGGEASLPLHEIGNGGGYYLGMFLGGAYQESIGGLHNLFGGPAVVRVAQSDGPHCFAVTRVVPGPSCGDVLRGMRHEPGLMFAALKQRVEERCGGDRREVANAIFVSFNSSPYLLPPCSFGVVDFPRGDDEDHCSLCYA